MAYIPKQHEKYDVLPYCRKHGGEVFSYPGAMMDELEKHLPKGKQMIPYGYADYEQYIQEMDCLADQYFHGEVRKRYEQFKIRMKEMNVKEEWSILRYVGETDDRILDLIYSM